MCDWREACEQIIEAGEKATERPWDFRDPHLGSKWWQTVIFDEAERNEIATVRSTTEDGTYVWLAISNADRLAEVLLRLANGDGVVSPERITRLWRESK